MRKFLPSLLLLCSLPLGAAPPAKTPPKLVLAIVVDQFRYDYLTRFRKEYHAGFERLLEHGAVFTNAHHIAVPTVTAIGHSTFLSGATPSISGIAGNEWYDREAKHNVTSVSDDSVTMVGGLPGKTGSSPHRLLVSTLGDELKMHGEGSKVIGISIKDRSAILPVGHMADAAYWFDAGSDHWVTSSYYRPELPDWVKQINDENPSHRFAKAVWRPVDAKESAQPFCGMSGESGVPVCRSLEATPWANEMIEELAEKAIVSEKLGQRTDTDILAVSFSANDYVGHAKGPDAPEVRDMSIRTDRLLGKLLDFVDHHVGPGNTVIVLTADHGVAPLPEVNQARKMPGGRLSNATLQQKVQDTLSEKYGPGKWVVAAPTAALYLNDELIRSKNLSKAEVEQVAVDALMTLPHAFRVYSGEKLKNNEAVQDFITRYVGNGYFPQRSADILFLADPFYLFESSGTSHGTAFNYDTHVPVIFMGPGIKPGSYAESAAVNDIAPTLANMLGVQFPSGSVGRVLSEMLH
jgi:predicted AlkP superfamily pyrophosphatase or phosphodiesterase